MKKFLWFCLILWLGLGVSGCATQDMQLSNEGFQAISKRDYAQAEGPLKKALSINPDNPYALLNMGVVYQETGRLDKARQMYERLIALQSEEVAEESNSGSFAGKGLVDIAKENLKLLEAQEAELAAIRKRADTASETTSSVSKGMTLPPPEKKKPAPGAAAALSSTPSPVPAKDVFCKVRENESLLDIAGRQDVYGDALKWPSLFRHNLSAMEKMKATESFPTEKLPEGLRLKYVSREQASEIRVAMGDKLWTVDVASAKAMHGLVPWAISLMRKGYPVYLGKSQLAGEEWIRLRVGFYGDILEALKASEEIKALLKTADTPMPIKVDKKEFERFAGY